MLNNLLFLDSQTSADKNGRQSVKGKQRWLHNNVGTGMARKMGKYRPKSGFTLYMYVSLAHKSVFWPRAFVKSLPDLLWNHRITDCSSIYNQCLSRHNASLSSNRCIMICCSVRLIALTMHSTAIFKQLTSESIQYRGSASRSLFYYPNPKWFGPVKC